MSRIVPVVWNVNARFVVQRTNIGDFCQYKHFGRRSRFRFAAG